jgi:hypothetical protein
MKARLRALAIALSVVWLPGCLYAHVKQPLDTDLSDTELGDKVGRASNHSVAWLVAWGDAGTQAAAEQGGLTVLEHADLEVFQVFFGFYTQTTTIVYGR